MQIEKNLTVEELKRLEDTDIRDLRREDLDNAGDIVIDRQKPANQRMREFLEKHEALMLQLSEAEDKVRELNRMKVHECFAVTKLTDELLDEYVESIEVHPGNEVKINWK